MILTGGVVRQSARQLPSRLHSATTNSRYAGCTSQLLRSNNFPNATCSARYAVGQCRLATREIVLTGRLMSPWTAAPAPSDSRPKPFSIISVPRLRLGPRYGAGSDRHVNSSNKYAHPATRFLRFIVTFGLKPGWYITYGIHWTRMIRQSL